MQKAYPRGALVPLPEGEWIYPVVVFLKSNKWFDAMEPWGGLFESTRFCSLASEFRRVLLGRDREVNDSGRHLALTDIALGWS